MQKYEWKPADFAARDILDRMLTESGLNNIAAERASSGTIGYNRVRDIRKGLKGPVKLSEFLVICYACDRDPVKTLKEIVRDAEIIGLRDNHDDVTDSPSETDRYRAMHIDELGLAAKHGDIEGEQQEYMQEP